MRLAHAVRAVVVVLAALILAGTAHAQSENKAAAEAAFRQGRDLMSKGDFAAACMAFRSSQTLDPQLGTQYNLGLCYEKAGMLASAWGELTDLAARDTNAKRRKDAAKAVFEIPIDLASVISCPADDWPTVLKGFGIAPAEKNPETGAVTLWRYVARSRPDGEERPPRRAPRQEDGAAKAEGAPRPDRRPERRPDNRGEGRPEGKPGRRPDNRQGNRPDHRADHRKGAAPAQPERRSKPIDPDSPFAALAALLPPPKPAKPARPQKQKPPKAEAARAPGAFRYRPFR